jgi:hypothetical protein
LRKTAFRRGRGPMGKRIEDMVDEAKPDEKPSRKNRGKMRREEREEVRRQLREMKLRGIDKKVCMVVLNLSRRQYDYLMDE